MFFWFAWVQFSEHLFHCLVWSTLFADLSICIHFIVKNSLTPQFLLLNEHFSQALFWEFAEYLKDVYIHWYCASLLHTLFIQECVQRVIKTIAKQYTVGGCPLTWCENITLGCTVTPIFWYITSLTDSIYFNKNKNARKFWTREALIVLHLLFTWFKLLFMWSNCYNHKCRCAWVVQK